MDLKIYVLRITTTVAFLRLFLPSVINDRATTASSQKTGNTLWTLRWLWGGFSRTRIASLKEKHLCRAGGWFPLYNWSCLALATLKALNQTSAEKVSKSADPFLVNDVIKIKQTDLSARNLIEWCLRRKSGQTQKKWFHFWWWVIWNSDGPLVSHVSAYPNHIDIFFTC